MKNPKQQLRLQLAGSDTRTFHCIHCGQEIRIAYDLQATRADCPSCHRPITSPPPPTITSLAMDETRQLVVSSRALIGLSLMIGCIGAVVGYFVLWPAYQSPTNRMYTSKLGFASVKRMLGKPFEVTTETVSVQNFETRFIGEGTLMSTPFMVPIVPMSKVIKVHVEEGDFVKKGALLVELDSSKASIKVGSAKLAIKTAAAERSRVEAGSAYVLAQERPEKDRINLDTAAAVAARSTEKLKTYQELYKRGIIARTKLLDAEKEDLTIRNQLQLAEFNSKMSKEGTPHSVSIAENAVQNAEQALDHRLEELEDYKVYAPADGIIERVLIREGEYNQDSGKPGFVIASGLYFEAHLDQSCLSHLKEGMSSEILLEAYAGHALKAEVDRIIPLVTYNQGGPETNRPMRPRGTGAPEWPATFKARLELKEGRHSSKLAPGMTGFARITARREAIAVRRSAVQALAAGKGLVHKIHPSGERTVEAVSLGQVSGDYIELVDGILLAESVIIDGHETLQPDDNIKVVAHREEAPAALAHSNVPVRAYLP